MGRSLDDGGRHRRDQGGRGECGFAMAALLVAIAVMTLLSSVAMPAWQKLMQREREEELIFRGEQYARAVALFQRKYGGGLPPNLDVLVEQRFLRKKYRDPMTPDGEFQPLYQATLAQQPGQVVGGPGGLPRLGSLPPGTRQPGQPGPTVPGAPPGVGTTLGPRGGVVGVMSKSTGQAIKIYRGRSRYEEWQFIYTNMRPDLPLPPGVRPGTSGAPAPGMPAGRPGSPSPTFPGAGRPTRPSSTPPSQH